MTLAVNSMLKNIFSLQTKMQDYYVTFMNALL